MNKRILYTDDNGGIGIIVPAISVELALKDVPSGKAYTIVDTAEIPVDRTFRNAWERQNNAVAVNMPKARNLKRDMIRVERAAELERLDVEFMRALENGNAGEQNRIKAEKQRYRDVPANPKIEQAATPDALKALTLADLI